AWGRPGTGKLGRHPALGAPTDGGQQEPHQGDWLGGEATAARPAAFPQRIHAEACATGCAAGALRGRPGPRRCNPDPSSATTDGYLISVRSTPGMRTTSTLPSLISFQAVLRPRPVSLHDCCTVTVMGDFSQEESPVEPCDMLKPSARDCAA